MKAKFHLKNIKITKKHEYNRINKNSILTYKITAFTDSQMF